MDTLPETFSATLAHYGWTEALTGYIPRDQITSKVSWQDFARVANSFGYRIVTEAGNVYGKIGLRLPVTRPAPKLRVITRSDHAAVYGGKR